MELLQAGGVIGAILYVVYYFIRRAKVDGVLSDLNRKDRTEEDKEIDRTTKELADAKVKYSDARRKLDDAINASKRQQ